MKIGIVGAGRVGSACALAAVVRGSARDVVIVDRTVQRAKAVATDLRYEHWHLPGQLAIPRSSGTSF
jgi:L-lactate dehydrogenase